MVRFICIVWSTRSESGAKSADVAIARLHSLSAFRMVHGGRSAGHALFATCESPVLNLLRNQGILLGTVFSKSGELSTSIGDGEFSKRMTDSMLANQGRGIVSDYWGRYVMIWRSTADGSFRLLRDPCGGIPCFGATFGGARIYFSRTADFSALGLGELRLDMNAMRRFLLRPDLANRETCLAGVSEVFAGECVEIDTAFVEHRFAYWNPVEVAHRDPIDDIDDATEATREVVQRCISAWSSSHQRVLLLLSGGLDSAVVLSGLRRSRSRPVVTCLNYADASQEGDERAYARQAAAAYGCTLHEHFRTPSSIDLMGFRQLAHAARPELYLVYLMNSSVDSAFAQEARATAIFDGGGGDQLFFIGATAYATADYISRHFLGRQLFRIALASARSEHRSLWSLLWSAFRRELSKPATAKPPHSFFERDFLEGALETPSNAEPRLPFEKALPPGKAFHARMLCAPQNYYNPLEVPYRSEGVHPLSSQPLVELFLRIETSTLAHAGHDRAVERKAFKSELPPAIINRRGKGGISCFMVELLRHHENLVREILLDGRLVKDRILSGSNIEAFLSAPYTVHSPGALALIDDCLSLEAWYSHWEETRSARSEVCPHYDERQESTL